MFSTRDALEVTSTNMQIEKEYEKLHQFPGSVVEQMDYREWKSDPGPLRCPMCCEPFDQYSGTVYLEYENKYAKLDVGEYATEEERGKAAYRKKRNERRARNRRRARENPK